MRSVAIRFFFGKIYIVDNEEFVRFSRVRFAFPLHTLQERGTPCSVKVVLISGEKIDQVFHRPWFLTSKTPGLRHGLNPEDHRKMEKVTTRLLVA